jgi:hypothetical protein
MKGIEYYDSSLVYSAKLVTVVVNEKVRHAWSLGVHMEGHYTRLSGILEYFMCHTRLYHDCMQYHGHQM